MNTQTTDRIVLTIVETPPLRQWVDAFIRARRAEHVTSGTIRYYTEKLNGFLRWCDTRAVLTPLDVTADIFRQYILWLEETGHNPGGRHGYYRAVRAFIRWWAAEDEPQGWRDPFKRVKPPKLPDEPLDPTDVETLRALLAATNTRMGERNRAILLVLYDAGLRARELCNLDLSDYDPLAGEVLVRMGKGQKTRTVFVGQKTRRTLRGWLRKRGATPGPLFIAEHGGRLGYKGLREVVQLAAKRAGIKPPPLHAFRRAFALNCLRAGMDLLSLQRLMGHADLSILHRYAKQTTDDLRAAHALASPVDRAGL
jgi:integrase/recombinase XerD